MTETTVLVKIQVPEGLHRRLKMSAAATDRTIPLRVVDILDMHLPYYPVETRPAEAEVVLVGEGE